MKKLLLLITLLMITTAESAFAQNGILKAQFTDSVTGQPLTIKVHFYTSGGAYVTSCIPTADGILIKSMAAGNYRMTTESVNYCNWTGNFTLTAGDTNRYYFDHPARVIALGGIKAMFYDSKTGAPYTDQIMVYRSNNTQYTQGYTNASGIYQLKLAPGKYTLRTYSSNYLQWYSDTLIVAPGDTNFHYFNNPVPLTPYSYIRAKFIRSTNLLPVGAIPVRTVRTSPTSWTQTYTLLDTAGTILIKVTAGTYYFANHLTVSSNYCTFQSNSVNVGIGDTNTVLFDTPTQLVPYGTIKARFIRSTDGNPVGPIQATLRCISNPGNSPYITLNDSGEHTRSVPPGLYCYTNHPYQQGGYCTFRTDTVEVKSDSTNDRLFTNPKALVPVAKIKIKFVRSTDGQPAAGLQVYYINLDNSYYTRYKTLDAQGELTLTDEPPGRVYFRNYPYNNYGYQSYQTPVVTLMSGCMDTTFYNPPYQLTPITGTLKARFERSIDNLPVGPIRVIMKHISPLADSQSVTLDSNGVFNQPVQVGKYVFTTLASNNYGYQTFVTDTVNVTANATNSQLFDTPVKLKLTTGILQARFDDAITGLPVGAIQLILRKTAPVLDSQVVTLNDSGEIMINVTPGFYQFSNYSGIDYGYRSFQTEIMEVIADEYQSELLNNHFALYKKINPCLGFNSIIGGYVDCGSDASLNVTDVFTAELWLNYSSNGTDIQYILNKGNQSSGYGGYFIRMISCLSNPTIEFIVAGTNTRHPLRVNAPSQNEWHHLAFVFNKPLMQIFIDGQLAGTTNSSNISIGNPEGYPLTLGSYSVSNGNYFSGSMDEVRIWNVALTQQEIQNSLNTQLTGQETGLIAYYPMDENMGNINDLAGFNSVGVCNSGINWIVHTAGGPAKTNGNEEPVITVEVPQNFALDQNYPNPFNPTTTIKYALKEDVKVSLKIYNALGQEVRTLVNETQSAGFKQIMWDGKNNNGNAVPTGLYIYRIVAGNFVKSNKMMLIK